MLERPFYFIIVLWGERFRNYFVDLCLPTLLSPRNLPALSTRQRSKFLVCTRPEDWAALQVAPVFRLLEHYVEPVYIQLPDCPSGVQACVHMGIGHRRGCELAYEAKAYPLVLTPDCIFCDGMMARLQELAVQGMELVLAPALRFEEETLFEHLEAAGVAPQRRNGIADPITLKNRDLVRMALASMHSETKSYEWEAPYFNPVPAAAWWRVPGEHGIVVHSLSWAPLLFDFAAVAEHDTSTFDEWTFDGDYVYRNLSNIKRVHLVLDSDEIFMASWGPSSERRHDLAAQRQQTKLLIGGHLKRQQFKAAFFSGIFDPFKQAIFFHAARWHANSLTPKWIRVERRAARLLFSCVAPPSTTLHLHQTAHSGLVASPGSGLDRAYSFVGGPAFLGLIFRWYVTWLIPPLVALMIAIERIPGAIRHIWIHRAAIIPRIRQLRTGDPEVKRWLKWRIREIAYHLVGRVAENKPARPKR